MVRAFLFIFLFSISTAYASDCAKNLRGFLKLANSKVEEAQASGRLLAPTFYDFKADQAAEITWKGVLAPRLIQQMLPASVRLIDHPLIGASEAGVVKDAGSGDFISLRLEVNGLGTNIGVSRAALIQNLSRPNKLFVRDQARAVIVFMHGGGTRTTGHHVGLSLMNHFSNLEVDVVSFDQAWHGEGPRKYFSSPRDYFEWVRAVIKETVGEGALNGKPVFLAGHSMGGEFADTYMRLYPGDQLVSGVIALSPVVDVGPGKPLKEKVKLIQSRDEDVRGENSPSPEDRELQQGLVKQGKLSFTALLFESLFSLQNSWVLPNDGGTSYVPSLYVWGAKDGLYRGHEKLVADLLVPIPKLRLQVYGKRNDLVLGRDVDVGHMIFDHHRPGTHKIEVFADIEDFIESTTGIKLEPAKKQSHSDDLLKKMVQTYANNLAFREFIAHHSVYRKIADTERMKALSARLSEINRAGNIPEFEAERIRILSLRQGFSLPEGPSGDLGRQWQSELRAVKKSEGELKVRREALRKNLELVRLDSEANKAAIENAMKGITSKELVQHEAEAERILSSMYLLNEKIEKAIHDFYLRLEAEGKLNSAAIHPPNDIQAFIREYEILYRSYQEVLQKKNEIIEQAANSGALGLGIRALYIERSGGAGSLVWKEESLRRELEEVESKVLDYEDLQQRLLVDLTNNYSEGLFRYHSVSLAEIFESDGKNREDYLSYLQDAWARWQSIWKERPPVARVSLY